MSARAGLFILMLASVAHARGIVERPEGCLSRSVFPCALGADSRMTIDLMQGKEALTLGLGKDAKLLLMTARELTVIAGEIAVLKSVPFQVRHGKTQLEFSAQGLLRRHDRDLTVAVLDGQAKIVPPHGDGELLVGGLQQTVGALHALNGKVAMKVAEPYDFSSTVVEWLKLAGADREEAQRSLERFRSLWKKSIEIAADSYAEQMGRRVASQEKKQAQHLDEEELRRQRDRHLRDLFRKRALGLEGR